ncbi:MAG: hypothetical protein NNA22_06015 [Nitrospira sp.]|nr:hypothetical protein [Nitrospira sp.]
MAPSVTQAQVPYGPGGVPQHETSPPGGIEELVANIRQLGPFRVIPTLMVTERYDSNIFAFRGVGGGQRSDFVTDVFPGARVTHSNDYLDGTLTGQAIASFYVNNPGLNYVGTQGSFTTVLDKMSQRVVRGLGLRLSGTVLYYPEQPSFVAAQSLQSDFTRGIQARRNNAISNTTTVQSAYTVSPSVQLNSSYSFQTMRFLGHRDFGDGRPTLPLFNMTTHGATGGMAYLVSPDHTIGVTYAFRQMMFGSRVGDSVVGESFAGRSFAIHGVNANWSGTFGREWRAQISPGLSFASQVPDRILWTINASLSWMGQGKSASVSFSRGLYPSFFGEAGLLASNVASGSVSYRLSQKWEVMLGANYAVNTRSGTGIGTGRLRFESINVNGTLRYALYRGISAALTGSHGDFTIEQAGTTFNYDRQIGMLTLTAEWD